MQSYVEVLAAQEVASTFAATVPPMTCRTINTGTGAAPSTCM